MRCHGLSSLGVSVKKTTVEKYIIFVLLARDINRIYVEYIWIDLQVCWQLAFLQWLGVLTYTKRQN